MPVILARGRRRDVCWQITSMAILGHILVNDGCGLHDILKGHRQFLTGRDC
jgi:hypothetical protein